MAKKKKTTNAMKILHRRYVKGPKRRASVKREHEKAHIAMQIYKLREQAGLTQKQLADRVGTTQSVISRLENADYQGHSMNMLEKIAAALHCDVHVELVPHNRRLAYA